MKQRARYALSAGIALASVLFGACGPGLWEDPGLGPGVSASGGNGRHPCDAAIDGAADCSAGPCPTGQCGALEATADSSNGDTGSLDEDTGSLDEDTSADADGGLEDDSGSDVSDGATLPINADGGDCGSVLPGMVCIPGGTFVMGSNDWNPSSPPHNVAIQTFQMDMTEVTVAAYRKCVDVGLCRVADFDNSMVGTGGECDLTVPGRDDYPINCVDVHDAALYCRWAGKRLPSEEEWEYAAQRNDHRTYPWGNRAPGAALLNVCAQECDSTSFPWNDSYPSLAAVGSFREGQSFDGLLDMAGNVWEWTHSSWCEYRADSCDACDLGTDGCANPCNTCKNATIIARGGGFGSAQDLDFHVYSRGTFNENDSWSSIGFRCAL
jgi:formylglycine-generating enzyme required for sulfatase activity